MIFVFPALSMALGSPLWSNGWQHSFQRMGNFVLMMTVSVLAHAPRRRLFWVFVPPSFWLVWSIADRVVMRNWPGLISNLHHNIPGAALFLVVGCISALLSGGFGKGREEPNMEPDFGTATQAFPQEGVWPPPPKRPD